MRPAVFIPRTVWCIHSPRTGEHWYIRCPSRSGAKIFLCGPLGPQVPTSKGPFEGWEVDETKLPPGTEILQASFFRANDPRNWQENTPQPYNSKVATNGHQSEVQSADAAQGSQAAGHGQGNRYRKGPQQGA